MYLYLLVQILFVHDRKGDVTCGATLAELTEVVNLAIQN